MNDQLKLFVMSYIDGDEAAAGAALHSYLQDKMQNFAGMTPAEPEIAEPEEIETEEPKEVETDDFDNGSEGSEEEFDDNEFQY